MHTYVYIHKYTPHKHTYMHKRVSSPSSAKKGCQRNDSSPSSTCASGMLPTCSCGGATVTRGCGYSPGGSCRCWSGSANSCRKGAGAAVMDPNPPAYTCYIHTCCILTVSYLYIIAYIHTYIHTYTTILTVAMIPSQWRTGISDSRVYEQLQYI